MLPPTPFRLSVPAWTVPRRSKNYTTALIGGTAPWIAQILVRATHTEAAPGVYVAVISGLALVAPLEVPETAFRNLD